MLQELVDRHEVVLAPGSESTLSTYQVTNKFDRSVIGVIKVTDANEIAYCAVSQLTNDKYAYGEGLAALDIENFVKVVGGEHHHVKHGWFGRKKLVFDPSGLAFSRKLAS